MRTSIVATILALGATFGVVGVAAARPVSEPASCAGYLASYANPNNGWIIQNLVHPAAEALGITVGQLTTSFASEHGGSLEACIPE